MMPAHAIVVGIDEVGFRPRRNLMLLKLFHGRRALDQLIEFAAIEPHPAALRAVIDLDPAAI